MKRSILAMVAVAAMSFGAHAQSIKESSIKFNYSKEASKAGKKGGLYNAGFFMSEDGSTLYKLSTFNQKKTNIEMLEVQTYSSDGAYKSTEVVELSPESLANLKLADFETTTEKSRSQLNNLEVTYIDNPTLAGKPSLVSGVLVPETNGLGVFSRFAFEKQGSSKIDDKFWAQVYYPVGDNAIDRSNYLLQPAPSKKLARELFKMRNSFMPKNNKAYIGGMMAVSGSDMFLSGIMDLNTNTWDSKFEIQMPHAFYPGRLNYIRLDNEETGILMSSKDQYTYLHLNADGSKKAMVGLTSPKTGGQNGVQPSSYLYKEGSDILCFTTTSKAMTGGNIGISVAKISGGVEAWNKTYTNDQLVEMTVLPAKEKVKANKLLMPLINNVMKASNGDYFAFVQANRNKSNGVETNYLILQFGNDGNLKANYALPAVEPLKNTVLAAPLSIRLIEAGDSYYAVVRSEVDGYQKGVYTDVSTADFGDFTQTTQSSYRVDESLTAGYVVKINPGQKTVSNVISFDDFLIGDFPGTLTGSNALFVNTPKEIVLIK